MVRRFIQHEIVETLFALATAAQRQGAQELFIGYPTATRYGFNADGAHYEGAVDTRVLTELRQVLTPQRRAILRAHDRSNRALTLGVTDLTRSVIYLSWPCPAARQITPRKSPPPPSAARILVIEDERQIAALISARLRRAGFDVVSCGGTAEARRALAAPGSSFDLLLSDLHLPGCNGKEFFRELRAGHNHLPIIVLTSECDPTEMRAAIDSGIDAYLWKGSEPELLLAWIRNLTNPERIRRFNV